MTTAPPAGARDRRLLFAAVLTGKALASYVKQRWAEPDPSYVTSGIGVVGWYSNLVTYHVAGLVTPEVARRQIGPDEPLSRCSRRSGAGSSISRISGRTRPEGLITHLVAVARIAPGASREEAWRDLESRLRALCPEDTSPRSSDEDLLEDAVGE